MICANLWLLGWVACLGKILSGNEDFKRLQCEGRKDRKGRAEEVERTEIMAKSGRTNRRRTSLPKLIEKYYARLADFARQNVLFEMGTRHAFHRLMADAGKEHGWMLIAEQEKKVGGKTIRPDARLRMK